MARIESQRMMADVEGDFVVFLIGMRVNALWRVDRWWPVSRAMPKMLQELSAKPELGLLGYRGRWGGRNVELIQYWRSFDQLRAYAAARESEHLPAWREFNRRTSGNDSVGIWHETYLVQAGQFETVYRNMPTHGLAAATAVKPATGRHMTAAGRLGSSRDG
ncbi:DUF4188 domain-containing protein [Salinisphaera hydrothermalis]|uniref:DUF4188 domain-containing protein n=1 Tax=Salinisphaera hydrothermalis TaxID=563188 RepID=UPI00333E890C